MLWASSPWQKPANELAINIQLKGYGKSKSREKKKNTKNRSTYVHSTLQRVKYGCELTVWLLTETKQNTRQLQEASV